MRRSTWRSASSYGGVVTYSIVQCHQSSPELHMKLLVVYGATAIYQVTRSFRQDERGPLHNPEYTIVEWYRVGDDLPAGMVLLEELVTKLLATPPAARTTYAAAFQRS